MSLLGSVLVVTFVLVAGSILPAAKRTHVARLEAPARGPLIDEADHPEWKQFLVLAAVQRAHEIERLRYLPNTPVRGVAPPAPVEPKVVTLPRERSDAEPEDATGSIEQSADSVIPVEIGAASSAELPIRPKDLEPLIEIKQPEAKNPDANPPPQAAPQKQSPRKPAQKTRRVKPAAKPAEPTPFNPFTALFGGSDANKK